MNTYREYAEQRIIGEQAAFWLCELAEGDPRRREDFLAWIRRSPHHVAQFLETSMAWKEFGRTTLFDKQEIEAIVGAARSTRDDSNVVTLAAAAKPADAITGRVPPRWRRPATIAAAIGALTIGTLVATGLLNLNGHTYSTTVAEQRAFRLTDGSLLHLNTHSRIEIQYSAHARDVKLVEGEALFNVRGNPARPFRVEASGVVIEAIGTQFNVQRREQDVTVSVIDGRVSVNGEQELGAGDQARIDTSGRITVLTEGSVNDAIAWRQRRLVFENTRLEDIVAEVNRYTPDYMRLDGDAVRDKRITGTFDADDPAALVLFLERLDTLRIERSGNGVVIGERRTQP